MAEESPYYASCTVYNTVSSNYPGNINRTQILTRTEINKWAKNFDDRLHHRGDFSLSKFNVRLNCFCGWPVGTLGDSMQGNPDVRAVSYTHLTLPTIYSV